jgi:hypothetical protein
MSAPSEKLSPEGTNPSGVPEAMAIEDADTINAASDVPVAEDLPSPSISLRTLP